VSAPTLAGEIGPAIGRISVEFNLLKAAVYALPDEPEPASTATIRLRFEFMRRSCADAIFAIDEWVLACTCGDRLIAEVTHHFDGQPCKPFPQSKVSVAYPSPGSLYPIVAGANTR
jgi:hypothetical protein